MDIFPERLANPINTRVRSTRIFITFASFERNISCILNTVHNYGSVLVPGEKKN